MADKNSQKILIDLKKNVPAADLVSDMEPSGVAFAKLTLISKDDQTAVFRLNEIVDDPSILDSSEEEDAEEAGEDPEEEKTETPEEEAAEDAEEEDGESY